MATLIPKYDQGATGAVNRPINLKLAETVSVLDFGADPSGVADSSAAIQAAIDSCSGATGPSGQSGGKIYFPRGTYKVNTPLNLTSTTGTLRAYIELIGEGNGTVINGNTGGRLFDCVGSNFLMFRDFYVVATGASPSNIIFQLARSTGAFNFCHHNRIENVTVNIPSIHSVNNGFGTIGLINIEGEDFSTFNFYSSANSPVMLLRQNNTLGITITSYAPLASAPVSFGQCTFVGKTLMQAWNAWQPPLHIDGVNSTTFENAHFAGGTSPWDSDTTSTWEYAIRTGATNAIASCNFFGLVESHKKLLIAQANIENCMLKVLIAGYSAIASDAIVNIQNRLIVGSTVIVEHGDAARRTFFTGTGQILNCNLSGYNVTDSLEPSLTALVRNTTYANDRYINDYAQKNQQRVILIDPINVVTPGTIISYIALPTVVSGQNAGFVSVKIEGQITTYGVKTQAAEPSVARFTSYVELVSTLTGTFTVGTPVSTLSTPVSGNAAVALITGLTFTAAVVSNVLQITASATASGSSAYTNGVNMTGFISLSWDGFSGAEGVSF